MSELTSTSGKTLTAIWNDVLQRSGDISASDGFFELGGDSVSMMMLLFKVEKLLQVEISPEQLFENDAFGSMLAKVDAARSCLDGASVAIPVEAG